MPKKRLKPKQELFCRLYASLDSDTYNKKSASALAAGYSESSASNMANRLSNTNPATIARIEEIYDSNANKHRGRILSHLEYGRIQAAKDRKWSDYMTSLKLQAQICGFLYESAAGGIMEPEPRELTKEQLEILQETAKKLNLVALKQARKDEAGEIEPFTDEEILEG